MDTINRLTTLFLITTSIWAADFQSGQAARVVIGQPSFTAREAGISPTTLVVLNNRLYVADTAGRLLTFDPSKIPSVKDDFAGSQGSECAVCGFSPLAAVDQPVFQGIAAVSVFGKTVAVADTQNHRILIWRDVSAPHASQAPDVVLGRATRELSAISASSIVEPVSVVFDGKRLFAGDAALHRVLVWNSLPAIDNQPADAVLGQPNFTSVSASDNPGPETIGRPAALASDGVNLFVGDTVNRRILVFTSADAPLSNRAVLNSASLSDGPIAPGTLITIDGSNFSDASESAPDGDMERLPRSLAGVQVVLDGVALPLLAASPSEVRAQVPYSLGNASAGSLYLRSERKDGSVTVTNAVSVRFVAGSPGLFAFGGMEPRSGLILHSDPNAPDQPGIPVTAENPAKPGEVIVLWAGGLGAVNDVDSDSGALAGVPYDGPDAPILNAASAFVGGRPAQVLSATLPRQAIGVYELRILLPDDLPSDPKTPLAVEQDGFVSNTVTIPVQNTVH